MMLQPNSGSITSRSASRNVFSSGQMGFIKCRRSKKGRSGWPFERERFDAGPDKVAQDHRHIAYEKGEAHEQQQNGGADHARVTEQCPDNSAAEARNPEAVAQALHVGGI